MVETIGKTAPYYIRQAHFDNARMAGSVPAWKNNDSDSISSSGPSTLSLANGGDIRQPDVTPPSLSFGELIDVVNPLQHIPVVGSVYRALTGDAISPVAQIAGGTLYGGPLGGLTSIATAMIEEHAGKSAPEALTKAAERNEQPHYTFADEERTAGMRSKQPKNDKETEIAFNESRKPIKNSDISWNDLANEKREPVTRVSIDVAVASATKPQWHFNS